MHPKTARNLALLLAIALGSSGCFAFSAAGLLVMNAVEVPAQNGTFTAAGKVRSSSGEPLSEVETSLRWTRYKGADFGNDYTSKGVERETVGPDFKLSKAFIQSATLAFEAEGFNPVTFRLSQGACSGMDVVLEPRRVAGTNIDFAYLLLNHSPTAGEVGYQLLDEAIASDRSVGNWRSLMKTSQDSVPAGALFITWDGVVEDVHRFRLWFAGDGNGLRLATLEKGRRQDLQMTEAPRLGYSNSIEFTAKAYGRVAPAFFFLKHGKRYGKGAILSLLGGTDAEDSLDVQLLVGRARGPGRDVYSEGSWGKASDPPHMHVDFDSFPLEPACRSREAVVQP